MNLASNMNFKHILYDVFNILIVFVKDLVILFYFTCYPLYLQVVDFQTWITRVAVLDAWLYLALPQSLLMYSRYPGPWDTGVQILRVSLEAE